MFLKVNVIATAGSVKVVLKSLESFSLMIHNFSVFLGEWIKWVEFHFFLIALLQE